MTARARTDGDRIAAIVARPLTHIVTTPLPFHRGIRIDAFVVVSLQVPVWLFS